MGRSKPLRRKYTKHYKKTFKVGKVSLGFVVMILFFIATLLFLSQSSNIAVRGYEISDLEKNITVLKEDNENLKIEAAKLQSVSLVQEKIDGSGMVPVGQINYLSTSTNVAFK